MISSNASTILPSNMKVGKVAALEAALDAFTVIRSPSGSTCDFVRLSASHVVGGRRIAFIKKAGFKVSKWIVVNGQEVLRNDSTCRSYVLKRRHATFLHELGDTLEQQAEKHHRGHGPTAACSRRRTKQATIQPKHPQTTTGNHSTRAAVGAARSREPPDPTEATRSRVCMTKKRRQASPPMCGQEIVINVDRKPLILLS